MAFHALHASSPCLQAFKSARRSCRTPAAATSRSRILSGPSALVVSRSSRKQLGAVLKASAGDVESRINKLTEEIKLFENERDQATKTAETLAKTSVKLLDMIELLDKLALEKVTEGDDASARNILKEKEEVKLMLEKTNMRAQNNFALAAKLAQAIGQKQADLVSVLPSSSAPARSFQDSEPTVSLPYEKPPVDDIQLPFAASRPFNTVPKWEASLMEAKERLQALEKEASAEAHLTSLGADDQIAAALQRLEMRKQDIRVHRERIRLSAEQSIVEARERLKKQEEEALEDIKWLMRRYRNGDYIPDYQLDSAFDKLQRRMYK